MTSTRAHCGVPFTRPRTSRRVTCSRSCQVALGWANMSPDARAARAQTAAGSGRRLNAARWADPREHERSSQLNRERWADPAYKNSGSSLAGAGE